MKNYIYILFFWLAICSCEDIVDADGLLDNNSSLVVINSFISPQDEIISARVSRTEFVIGQPIDDFNNGDKYSITNAIVSISDTDGNQADLSYSSTSFKYEVSAADFPIVGGKKYFLKVLVDGKEFNAFCEVPNQKIQNISEDIGEKINESGGVVSAVKVRFDDISGEENFYIIGAERTGLHPSGEFERKDALNFESERFATDKIGDGERISSEGFLNFTTFLTNDTLIIKVAHVELALYQSLFSSYLNTQNEGSPIEEVVIPPNNILEEGGFGVFAGYQLTEKEIIL